MDENEKEKREINEALRKQLHLLSGRSESPRTDASELPALSHAMVEVVAMLCNKVT